MSTFGRTTEGLTLNSRLTPAPELLSSELDGEAVILDLATGVYYGLNGVGARIWELLGEARGLRTIRETLVEEFEVDPARCEADLMEVVGRMAASGLVRVSE
jgi:hypothetical protein